MGDTWNLSTKITRIEWQRIKRQTGPKAENTAQGPFHIKNVD